MARRRKKNNGAAATEAAPAKKAADPPNKGKRSPIAASLHDTPISLSCLYPPPLWWRHCTEAALQSLELRAMVAKLKRKAEGQPAGAAGKHAKK